MTKIASVLESIKANAGGEAALLIAGDGRILASTADADATLTSIATYAANYLTVSERMGEDTQRGVTQALIVIYHGKAVVLSPLGPSACAVIVGSRTTHLGNLRYQLRRGIGDLVRAVGEDMPELHLEVRAPLSERPLSPIKPPPPPEVPKATRGPVRPPVTSRTQGIDPHRDGKERSTQTPGIPATRMPADSAPSKGVDENKGAPPPTQKPVADMKAGMGAAAPAKPEVPAPPRTEPRTEPAVPPGAKPPAATPKADVVAPTTVEKGAHPKPDEVTPPKPETPPEAPSASAPSSASTPRPSEPIQEEPEPAAAAQSESEVEAFMVRVKDTIEKMQTHPGAFSIAVLALEGFNEITPPLARAARSALIHLCGERLRKALRSVDLAVQFKDGTFGLLLAGVRSNQARAVVQRVTAQVLEGNLEHPKGDATFRLRAGIATYPEGGASAERLLRRATTALFISQIEGAMGASRTPPAEFSVAVLSLEGEEKDHESPPGASRGFPLFVQRLEGTLRAVDVATQLDDRKYGVLLMGVNHTQASAIVERIRDQILKDNLGLPPNEVTFRLRAGIATYPEAGPLADGLLYHAESSLTFLAP